MAIGAFAKFPLFSTHDYLELLILEPKVVDYRQLIDAITNQGKRLPVLVLNALYRIKSKAQFMTFFYCYSERVLPFRIVEDVILQVQLVAQAHRIGALLEHGEDSYFRLRSVLSN